MKLIFALLVLLNIAVAAWYFTTDSSDMAVVAVPADVGNIKIVSDVELQARAEFQEEERRKQHLLEAEDSFEQELPRPEYDDFIFDDSTEQLVCRQLGPFLERGQAIKVAGGLAAYRIAAKIKKSTSAKVVGYWAILPAPATREEANALVDELRDKGFRDVRRFLTGDMENSISLGLFSTEINAQKRTRVFEQQGYIPIVKAKKDEKLLFWLEFEQSSGFQLPMQQIHETYPDVKIKACDGIAQG
ncbi:MAG: hypothetical protein PVG66_16775 [Chromatiales bacterium]|jgi:hypothetical protein